MSKTESTMIPLGTLAPDFELEDVCSNTKIRLASANKYSATLIVFLCNHCPYVKHINAGLSQFANDYIPKGVRILAINSNDIDRYPDDSPDNMVVTARDNQYPFPYLYDETQEVARAYQAACTPDFFLFDTNMALVYRGEFDDSRPGNMKPVTGNSLRYAIERALSGNPVDRIQKPSLGCNIKWK